MINVANDNQALKKRITRFFESPKRAEINSLIGELSKIGEVIAFGGVIRDLALYGIQKFNSDIDLVIDCPPERLREYTENSPHIFKINKFNGYRTRTSHWTVDIWPITKTWAFENNHIKYTDRNSLLLTTITNWDATAYSFKDQALICRKDYLRTLKSGELDLVLESNPNNTGVLLRTLRAIFDNKVRKIMPKALSYLKKELTTKSSDEIIFLQHEMFGKEFFTKTDIEEFKKDIENLNIDLFGSNIQTKGVTRSLI